MSGLARSERLRDVRPHVQKIDQIEAEAEAEARSSEEYTGDSLVDAVPAARAHAGSGDDDLVALKRKMGMLPPERRRTRLRRSPSRRASRRRSPARRSRPKEQEELAAALEEMEAEQQAAEKRKAATVAARTAPRDRALRTPMRPSRSLCYYGRSGRRPARRAHVPCRRYTRRRPERCSRACGPMPPGA